jgi:hypothetical protein
MYLINFKFYSQQLQALQAEDQSCYPRNPTTLCIFSIIWGHNVRFWEKKVACRLITGAFKMTPIDALNYLAHIPPIELRLNQASFNGWLELTRLLSIFDPSTIIKVCNRLRSRPTGESAPVPAIVRFIDCHKSRVESDYGRLVTGGEKSAHASRLDNKAPTLASVKIKNWCLKYLQQH